MHHPPSRSRLPLLGLNWAFLLLLYCLQWVCIAPGYQWYCIVDCIQKAEYMTFLLKNYRELIKEPRSSFFLCHGEASLKKKHPHKTQVEISSDKKASKQTLLREFVPSFPASACPLASSPHPHTAISKWIFETLQPCGNHCFLGGVSYLGLAHGGGAQDTSGQRLGRLAFRQAQH